MPFVADPAGAGRRAGAGGEEVGQPRVPRAAWVGWSKAAAPQVPLTLRGQQHSRGSGWHLAAGPAAWVLCATVWAAFSLLHCGSSRVCPGGASWLGLPHGPRRSPGSPRLPPTPSALPAPSQRAQSGDTVKPPSSRLLQSWPCTGAAAPACGPSPAPQGPLFRSLVPCCVSGAFYGSFPSSLSCTQ